VEDHDGVAVLLWGQLEEGEQLVVVDEVADGGGDDGGAGGAELGELSGSLVLRIVRVYTGH